MEVAKEEDNKAWAYQRMDKRSVSKTSLYSSNSIWMDGIGTSSISHNQKFIGRILEDSDRGMPSSDNNAMIEGN